MRYGNIWGLKKMNDDERIWWYVAISLWVAVAFIMMVRTI
tara:strand:+ start:562 stop:681 length:120 start_codon:yes stop_codon:yes gene_type:complete